MRFNIDITPEEHDRIVKLHFMRWYLRCKLFDDIGEEILDSEGSQVVKVFVFFEEDRHRIFDKIEELEDEVFESSEFYYEYEIAKEPI